MDPRKAEGTPTTKQLFDIRDSLLQHSRSVKGRQQGRAKGKGKSTEESGTSAEESARLALEGATLEDAPSHAIDVDYPVAFELSLSTVTSPKPTLDTSIRFNPAFLALEVLELLLSTSVPVVSPTSSSPLCKLYTPAFLLQITELVYKAWSSGSSTFLQKCRSIIVVLLTLSAKLDISQPADYLRSEALAAPWLFRRTISAFDVLMRHLEVQDMEGFALCRGEESAAAGVLRRIVGGMGVSDEIATFSGRVASEWIEKVWRERKDVDEDFWVQPVADVCREGMKGRTNIPYLLAGLFKKKRSAFRVLLDKGGFMVGNGVAVDEETLQAAVAILKIGNAQGLIDTEANPDTIISTPNPNKVILPSTLLSTCLLHASPSLRCAALSLLVVSQAAIRIPSTSFALLKTFYLYSLGEDDAEFRMESIALTGKLLLRLRDSTWKAATKKDDAYVAETVEFMTWWADHLFFNLNPAKPFRIQLGALRFLDLLFQAQLDPTFASASAIATNGYSSYRRTAPTPAPSFEVKPRGEMKAQRETSSWPFTIPMVTPKTTFFLLRLLLSTYTSLRALTIALLERFPSPLPGYEGPDGGPRAQKELLEPALRMVRSGREAEASAGAGIIGLVWRKWLLEGTHAWDLGTIGGWRETAGRQTEGSAGFSFLNDLMDLADLQLVAHRNDLGRAAATSPMHGTILALRQLFVSIPIASLDTLWSAEELRVVFHRALKIVEDVWRVTAVVLAASAPEGSFGASALVDTEEARAQAFASEDLDAEVDFEGAGGTGGPMHKIVLSATWRSMKEAGELLETILRIPSELSDTTFCHVWPLPEVQHIGDLFATWLARIRHRGTVMALHPCYSRACAALLLCEERQEVQNLPLQWLDVHIDSMVSQKISITRRSAGIPYSIMGILTVVVPTNRLSFDSAFERVFAIAESTSTDILDESRVHAMNTLRTAFQEAKATAATLNYMERAFLISISMFWSTNWICRNAAMMLFGALVTKAIGGGRTNVDRDFASLIHRLSMPEFFKRYPKLPAALLAELDFSTREHLDDVPTSDMHSSLFSVLMLLSLLQTPNRVAGGIDPDWAPFFSYIQLCARSRVWKIRVAAADALTGLVPPSEVYKICSELLDGMDGLSENELHGRLLQVHRLLLAFPTMTSGDCVAFGTKLSAVAECILTPQRSFATRSTYLDVACLNGHVLHAVEYAVSAFEDICTLPGGFTHHPSGEVFAHSAAKLLLASGRLSSYFTQSALSSPLLSVQQAVLDSMDAASASDYRNPLLHLALNVQAPPACRCLAAELLTGLNWTEVEARQELPGLKQELERTKVIPFREAMLPLVATVYNLVADAEQRGTIFDLLDATSTVTQSIEARDSAARALAQLTAPEFLRTEKYARLLVRLLQDDDTAVRNVSSSIVTRWWSDGMPLSTKKQVELVLESAGSAPLSYYGAELEADLNLLSNPSPLLFVVEKPNIFVEETLEAEFERENLDGASSTEDELQSIAEALAKAVGLGTERGLSGPLGVLGDDLLCKWSLRIDTKARRAKLQVGVPDHLLQWMRKTYQ